MLPSEIVGDTGAAELPACAELAALDSFYLQLAAQLAPPSLSQSLLDESNTVSAVLYQRIGVLQSVYPDFLLHPPVDELQGGSAAQEATRAANALAVSLQCGYKRSMAATVKPCKYNGAVGCVWGGGAGSLGDGDRSGHRGRCGAAKHCEKHPERGWCIIHYPTGTPATQADASAPEPLGPEQPQPPALACFALKRARRAVSASRLDSWAGVPTGWTRLGATASASYPAKPGTTETLTHADIERCAALVPACPCAC